jgi:shikimate dehydrogenase
MKNKISGKAAVCGIIGYPLSHSLSPVMHNAAFADAGLDWVYVPLPVKPEGLEAAIAGIRALNIRGVNITMPHKVTVMPLLDYIEPTARQIGAVNTLVNDNGKLTGCNTDAPGFLQALNGIELPDKKAVLLGAGGAARAIGFALAAAGSKLYILDRTPQRARELAQHIGNTFRVTVSSGKLNDKNMRDTLARASILVNATTLGMFPEVDDSPAGDGIIPEGITVFDAVYAPSETKLLRQARIAGAIPISGLEMLVRQGAIAYEYWTGRSAPVAVMRTAAAEALAEIPFMPVKKTNIAIIGFMGTGKTTVGRRLASILHRQFVDIDDFIERNSGKDISGIFAEEGETAFRKMESKAIRQATEGHGQVIACGGGAVLHAQNITALKKTSVVVRLTAAFETIIRRTACGSRPLLTVPDREITIKALLAKRQPYYDKAADITIDTTALLPDEVAGEIIRRLKNDERINI